MLWLLDILHEGSFLFHVISQSMCPPQKNCYPRHHQGLDLGDKLWTKPFSCLLNFSFNSFSPNLNPFLSATKLLEMPDIFWSVVFVIKLSQRLWAQLLSTLSNAPAVADWLLCVTGVMNIAAWSLLLLGWVPYACKSMSQWGSQGGTTCPFSWHVWWGKWHEVGSITPNQTAASSAGAELGQEPAPSPSWGNSVDGDSPGWGQKISASVCGAEEKWVPVPSPGTSSELQPNALQAWFPLTEEQWWRERCPWHSCQVESWKVLLWASLVMSSL